MTQVIATGRDFRPDGDVLLVVSAQAPAADGGGAGEAHGGQVAGADAVAPADLADPSALRSGTFLRRFLADRRAGRELDEPLV